MRCLVSIPPVIRGEKLQLVFTSGLQCQLIRSWLDSGFKPVSINTPDELKCNPEHAELLHGLGVDVLEVPPSGGNYPSYLPNLRHALLLAAEHYPEEVIAITNADIHIRLDDSTREKLNSLVPDQFYLAHRMDVSDDSLFSCSIQHRKLQGLHAPFLPGIDFIAARSLTFKQACAYLSPDLTIGLPWWDLLLPICLYAAGAHRQFLDSLCFLHLKHEERWNPRWLDQVGSRATDYLHNQIVEYKAPAMAYVWSLAYAKLRSPLQTPSVYKSRMISRFEWFREGRHCPVYLPAVLRMTEALVCEQGWELDRRWIGAWYADSPLLTQASQGHLSSM